MNISCCAIIKELHHAASNLAYLFSNLGATLKLVLAHTGRGGRGLM